MPISEEQRFQLHLGLRTVMGDEVANTLMEHLPPWGWADVARKSDIDRLDKRIDGVVSGLWALGGIMSAGFVGLFALIATKF